jgi:hypothetical protein
MKKFIVVLTFVFISQNRPLIGAECQSGWLLIANVWSMNMIPMGVLTPGLHGEVKELIRVAESRDSREATLLSAYRGDAVSRTLGARLRSEVKIRAPIADDIQVRYLDAHSGKLMYDIGVVNLKRGVGSFKFPDDPRTFVVETLWPIDFISPTMSGGQRRLRLFPEEWKQWCTMNVHGLVP